MTTSTIRIPPRAVIDAACPDGNDFEDSSACSSCHSGRALPISSLRTVYVAMVVNMTPTVKSAARRWPRTSISTATASVMIVMPRVLNMTSMTRSGSTSQSDSTAYSAVGEPRSSNCATGPQPWTTASVTRPKSRNDSAAQPSSTCRDRSSKGRPPVQSRVRATRAER